MPSSLVSEGGLITTLSSIGPSNITATKLRVLDLRKRTTGVPIGEEVRAAIYIYIVCVCVCVCVSSFSIFGY